jgi:hypothetical protein
MSTSSPKFIVHLYVLGLLHLYFIVHSVAFDTITYCIFHQVHIVLRFSKLTCLSRGGEVYGSSRRCGILLDLFPRLIFSKRNAEYALESH